MIISKWKDIASKWNTDKSIYIYIPDDMAEQRYIKDRIEEGRPYRVANIYSATARYLNGFIQTNSNSFTSLSESVNSNNIFNINNILFPIEPISDEYGNILYRMGDTTTYLDYYKIDFIDGPNKYNDKNIYLYITNQYVSSLFGNDDLDPSSLISNYKLLDILLKNINQFTDKKRYLMLNPEINSINDNFEENNEENWKEEYIDIFDKHIGITLSC